MIGRYDLSLTKMALAEDMRNKQVKRYQNRKVPFSYALVDLILPGILLLFFHVLFGGPAWEGEYYWISFLSGLFFATCIGVQSGYSRRNEHSLAKKIEITFKTWFFNVFLLLILLFFYLTSLSFDRFVISIWVVLTPLLILSIKLLIHNLSRKYAQAKVQVAVLGRHYEFNEFEFAVLELQGIELNYFSLQETENIHRKISQLEPDYLLLNLETPASNQLIKELTHLDLKGVRLMVLHRFMEVFLRKCYIPYGSEDLSYLEKVRSYSLKNYLLKRCIDWAAVIGIGIASIPIIVVTALQIKRQSPGPILFKQRRVGMGGKDFVAFKFRSMHEDGHFDPYTQVADPRIFPFGETMRKFRIDEIPQLWNVAKGDMHLGGPRTEWDILVEEYEKEIPYYHERHLVRPGISGWAQVSYPYGANIEDARQKLMYDLYYIKHWSIWLELETLIRTVGVVLGRKGV